MEQKVESAIAGLERFMPTVADALPIPRDAAEFVHSLVLAARARRAVEIGTSYGYSGLWIASALARNAGTLITIDHSDRKTDAARANFKAAGLHDVVELRTGAALDLLPQIAGPIDFVLNDADKENCARYVELLIGKLSERAVVLTDNTITHAEQLAGFIRWIRNHPSFASCAVPVGNGMEMSVKIA